MAKENLIVIDGLDGSGKTTQHNLFLEYLKEQNIPAMGVSFPDYDQPSSALVKMYLQGEFGKNPGDVGAYAASSFYAVDRYASYKKFWGSAYHSGTAIVCARYTSSNMFHQMSKLDPHQWDEYLYWAQDYEYNKLGIPAPSKVIFLDMDPAVAKKLISSRYQGDETQRDIHEQDYSYLLQCREAALYACEKCGYQVIACSDGENPFSIEDIQQKIREAVSTCFQD